MGDSVADGEAVGGADRVGVGLGEGDVSWANVLIVISPNSRHTDITQAVRNFLNTCLFPSMQD